MNRYIPSYSLYGEQGQVSGQFSMHTETIASRSKRYDWEISPHRHEALFQILHIRLGQVRVTFGKEFHLLKGPCIIIVPPGHEHGFHFTRDIDGAVMTLVTRHFPICSPGHPGLGDWLSRPRFTEPPQSHADSAYLSDTLNRLESEIAGANTQSFLFAQAHLTTALMMLKRMDLPEHETENHRDSRRFETLVSEIQKEFRLHHPVGFYARKLGISVTHLNRITHAFAGKSASRLIADHIITEAQRDLVFTTYPIQRVADNLGFEDAAYFSRFFSRHTGMSPRTWRERETPKQSA